MQVYNSVELNMSIVTFGQTKIQIYYPLNWIIGLTVQQT